MPIVRRAAEAVDQRAEDIEKRDKAEAAEFSVPHVPSETILALRTKARCLRTTAEALEAVAHSQGSPLQILKECGIDLSE